MNLNSRVDIRTASRWIGIRRRSPPDGYLILRRSHGDSDYEEIGIVFAVEVDDPTTYTDDRLESADTYEYAVMAIFLDGDASDVSESVIGDRAGRGFGIADAGGDRDANGDGDSDSDRSRRLPDTLQSPTATYDGNSV